MIKRKGYISYDPTYPSIRKGVFVGILCFAIMTIFDGCSASQRAKMPLSSYQYNYKVTLYSGGKLISEWHTIGKVHSEGESDGYYFLDKQTNRLIEIAGDIIIEQEN